MRPAGVIFAKIENKLTIDMEFSPDYFCAVVFGKEPSNGSLGCDVVADKTWVDLDLFQPFWTLKIPMEKTREIFAACLNMPSWGDFAAEYQPMVEAASQIAGDFIKEMELCA